MFRPRVIPVLLLKDLGLVKTFQFGKPKYIGDPINTVKIFNNFKADEIIFLDISATKNNSLISTKFIRDVGEQAFMPFAVGGGIRTLKQAENCIKNGAEKIVINSHSLINHKLIVDCVNSLGQQSVVVSIDVRKSIFGSYKVYRNGGRKKTSYSAKKWALIVEDLGAGEIMINDIRNDGVMKGYDLDLINDITESVSVPVIACGGAGTLNDIKLAIDSGAHAVAAGSLFVFQGPRKGVLVNYPSKSQLESIFDD